MGSYHFRDDFCAHRRPPDGRGEIEGVVAAFADDGRSVDYIVDPDEIDTARSNAN